MSRNRLRLFIPPQESDSADPSIDGRVGRYSSLPTKSPELRFLADGLLLRSSGLV